jgi:uncharacterized protein YegJ (DUF2314 family)
MRAAPDRAIWALRLVARQSWRVAVTSSSSWSARIAEHDEFRVNPTWDRGSFSGRWPGDARLPTQGCAIGAIRFMISQSGVSMRHAGLIGVMLALISSVAGAQTTLERAERDEIARVARDDPDMAEAMRKARASLPEFLKLVRAPPRSVTSYAVKVGIRAGDDKEFFWISPFERRSLRFVGIINNTPRMATSVRPGQVIQFSENEIVDWLYREGGRMHGNFTACALLKREPPDEAEAFKREHGLTCDP